MSRARQSTPKTWCPECGGPSTLITPVGALLPKSVQLHAVECSRRENPEPAS